MVHLGGGLNLAWGIIGTLGAIAAVAGLVWTMAKGHGDRDAEDEARDFFDRHGHWPDDERITTP